ncbi:S41 family peptidase [Facilibium subflavum]|uniref:S41 family peptidase n=1 Tax=Facilibium subflavum TaxID=2219058 RepID=UPI000E64B694|nr:S41 family peptidase [Facilibium subflavum]
MKKIILIILCCYSCLFYAVGVFAASDKISEEEIEKLSRSIQLVKQMYVEELSDKEIFEAAIDGMLQSLDPHSEYLSKNDLVDLELSTTGKFAGLGMHVTKSDDVIKVISAIDNTPAYKAGIQPGDLIIKIDDHVVSGMTLDEAVSHMRGETGTKVKLTILRAKVAKPIQLTLARETIIVDSVSAKLLEDNYGYIRISQFQKDTAKDVKNQIDQLQVKNKIPLKGLVLDLRNNPGGLLEAAVGVSDIFLENPLSVKHKIVDIKSRTPEESLTSYVITKDYSNKLPLVVLVNMGSASASEIVAGALQDHRRAIIVGEKTFGKGSVQTVIPVSRDTAIKLTTARYYTPKGRSIQGQGIIPDIIIKQKQFIQDEEGREKEMVMFEESSYSNALSDNNTADNFSQKLKSYKKRYQDDDALYLKDYQLFQALKILKAVSLTKNQE